MSRSPLPRYGLSMLAVAVTLLLTGLLSPRGLGAASLLLAAVTLSAWQGGLGPGLLASAVAALTLDLLLPRAYSPGAGWSGGLRLSLFLAAAGVISGLSARQQLLERTLRQQDRRKDELLATLAHELRSPISAILNASHLLRLASADTEAGEHALTILERQSRAIAQLAEDLLDVSRAGLGKLRLHKQRVDVAAVVTEAVESVRPLLDARGHRLEVSLPSAPVYLDADPTRLGQVLVNLLANAANYTESGGHVRLAVEREDDEVCLRVRDTGVGLSPEMLPRVFDLFVQAENGSRGGLGLGLSLVRRLVELHGGSVTAHSEGPGRGSEFVARFPSSTRPEAGM